MRLSRRNFLQLGAGACLASTLPFKFDSNAFGDGEAPLKESPLNIVKFTLDVGATQPFTAVHVSDTHICFADERENERKLTLAKNRSRYFTKGEANFLAALDYAQKKNALFLHTGDMIDFVSEKNLDYVADVYKDVSNRFVSSGNHEFSQYVGEAREDEAYKAQSFARVQKSYPNDLTFCSKIVNGVNFIAFDDVYYYVAEDLLDKFKAEVEKGLPIVTLCHVPFYTPELFKHMIVDLKEPCAYVAGAPQDAMKEYKQDRFTQQLGDEKTIKFIEWLKKQSLVKALLCGHLHINFDEQFSESARQYVVGGNFKGDAYEFEFV